MLLLAALLLAGYALLGSVDALDPAALLWIRARTGDAGWLVTFTRGITALGNDTTLWLVAVMIAGYMAVGRRWRDCGQLVTASALGGIGTLMLKLIVHRSRPAIVPHLIDVHSLSFPSGHATNSTFVYGTLALIASRHARSDRQRRYLGVVLALLLATIGCSRVVLGVHWPSDVLAGWALGATWAVSCDLIFGRPDVAPAPIAAQKDSVTSPVNDRPG